MDPTLVVKHLTLLLTSSEKNGNFTLLLTYVVKEWQFHLLLTTSIRMAIEDIATDILWSRMAISHSIDT